MQALKYGISCATIPPWIERYESILSYVSKLNASKKAAAMNLYLFCDWCGKNPDELLSMKNAFDNFDVEKHLDKLVYSKTKFPETRKWYIIISVRGFFRANYRQLQGSAGKMEYPTVKTQNTPSKQKRLAIYKACYLPIVNGMRHFIGRN